MLWLSNIESISTTGTAGICPHCKSQNTEYSLYRVRDDVGCGDIWCNECKRAFHISRIKITTEFDHNVKIPKGLIY